ncbi:hypothetical protein Lalb_Chr25g0280961 [Lupinus albus]|uniref:Uncharacterized protein n=1 Tax=Lupinus albus TaxID=3870 RepID=A0A6A4MXR0_LUPAL|nr:hypothetical protein Lalb_Chr25g0280961 [Lupinus albus]
MLTDPLMLPHGSRDGCLGQGRNKVGSSIAQGHGFIGQWPCICCTFSRPEPAPACIRPDTSRSESRRIRADSRHISLATCNYLRYKQRLYSLLCFKY